MNLKTPFSSKPFISLHQDSVNGNVVYPEVIVLGFVGVLLMDINTSAVFCWSLISNHYIHFNFQQGALAISSSVGSLVGCYIHFNFQQGTLVASSLVGSLVGSSVSSQVNSLVSSSFASSLGSFNLSYRYGFITVVLKLIGSLGSCTLYISPLIPSSLNGLVHLLLCLVLPFCYINTSKLRGRSWIVVTDGPFRWFNALLTYFFALILTISSIAFFMAATCYIINGANRLSLLI